MNEALISRSPDRAPCDGGGDDYVSRLAATLVGSTDTTFYVLAVYFGAVAIRLGLFFIYSLLFFLLWSIVLEGSLFV